MARTGTTQLGSNGVRAGDGAQSLDDPVRFRQLFDRFPYGLVLVAPDGSVLGLNRRATELLGVEEPEAPRSSLTCCELICEPVAGQVEVADPGCLTRRALGVDAPLPEVRIDIERNGAVSGAWITAATIDPDQSRLLFHVRPAAPRDRRRRLAREWSATENSPDLRIHTLGGTRIESGERSIGGEWVDQRPGQLLKYLVCQRDRLVASDQIAEALWPEAGPGAVNRVRHYVHALRDRLEPERTRRAPSRFVVARRGGYMLHRERVWIDADEFEDGVGAGLTLFVQGESEAAAARLERALSLYQGDFLAEDPYAEWSLEERDGLRELAGRGLRALVRVRRESDDLQAAAEHARRLAEMEPFDMDVQREFIEICLSQGRRSEAVRRYALVRKRAVREFGTEPDFTLSELSA